MKRDDRGEEGMPLLSYGHSDIVLTNRFPADDEPDLDEDDEDDDGDFEEDENIDMFGDIGGLSRPL